VHLFMRRHIDIKNQRPSVKRRTRAFIALSLALALCTHAAMAQVSGSLSVLSDYRFRGRSLNNGNPTPQLTLNYDSDNGWYAGAQATHATVDDTGTAQLIAYGGYAHRLSGGLSWEAGLNETVFTRTSAYNYAEAYVGLAAEQISARVYYAPHYFGRPYHTVYGEVNGFLPLAGPLRLTGHAGILHAVSGEGSFFLPSGNHYDTRIGLAATIGDWSVQLARATRTRSAARYPGDMAPRPPAFVLSAAYSF
jgi:uncharacterized protein (TIGR02001 family)